MSSDNETDSVESYQTDDSDINFIPGYIMECPERAVTQAKTKTTWAHLPTNLWPTKSGWKTIIDMKESA